MNGTQAMMRDQKVSSQSPRNLVHLTRAIVVSLML